MNRTEHDLTHHGFCIVDVDASHRISAPIALKYTMMALCLDGTVSYEMNMEHGNLRKGMCVCYPHIMLMGPVATSDDFKARVFLMHDDLLLNSLAGIETSVLQMVFTHPIPLGKDRQRWDLTNRLLECLAIQGNIANQGELTSTNKQIISQLIRSLFLNIVEYYSANSDSELPAYTMADTYFRRFLQLIDIHLKQEHEVTFYAKKLNITPKYLSEICKSKTRRKAKEIVSAILLNRIKNDIIMSGLSIKELAAEYGFADQSSLGKFFRKMTGISPIQFRQYGDGENNSTIN